MTKPIRVQRRRTKGWRMPPNTVYVGRPSKWGNPFDWQRYGRDEAVWRFGRALILRARYQDDTGKHVGVRITQSSVRSELRGKNLACWCPVDQPCHADVLLRVANETP